MPDVDGVRGRARTTRERISSHDMARPKVFISYSRADLDLADELVAGLEFNGFDVSIDRQSIAAGEDFQARLGRLILAADTVVFVLSPDALSSDSCRWEINECQRLAKRVLPILCRPVDFARAPPELRFINAIQFTEPHRISGLNRLVLALESDLEWLREHTRIAERAAEWHAAGRSEERLLRGKELTEAKDWLNRKAANAPAPTDLQHAFLAASEDAETARASAERKRLEEMAAVQRDRASALQAAEDALIREAHARKQRAKLRNVGTALLLIVATVAVWQAWRAERQKTEAQHLRRSAIWKVLAFEAPRQKEQVGDDDLAGLLARQALLVHKSLERQSTGLVDYSLASVFAAQPFRHVLRGHLAAVLSLAFAADGQNLVSGGWDRSIRFWDMHKPSTAPLVLPGLPGGVWSVALSPDGKRLVAGYDDGTVHVLDFYKPQIAPIALLGHARGVQSVAFSPDGQKLATAGVDGNIRVWDSREARGWPLVLSFSHPNEIWSITFSPDGQRLVSGSEDGAIQIWDLRLPEAGATTLIGHVGAVKSVAISPDGHTLASGSSDRTIRLWDLNRPQSVSEVLGRHQGGVLSIAFSPDGQRLASGGEESILRVWELRNRHAIPVELATGSNADIRAVVFSPDGQKLVSAGEDTAIRIWELRQLHSTNIGLASPGAVHTVAFSPDGKTFASAGSDKMIRIWDMKHPQAAPMILSGHESDVWSIAFGPDGHMLASGSADKSVRIWNLRQGGAQTAPLVLKGHEGGVWSIAFRPDGRMLASGSADGTIRLWNVNEPQKGPLVLANGQANSYPRAAERPCFSPMILAEHKIDAYSVAFSPDQRTLASGGADQNVRLWDLSNLDKAPIVLKGHQDFVCAVLFSLDGGKLASASGDNSIRLWNLHQPDAAPIVMSGHSGDVLSLALTPDGRRLASGSADRTIRVWDLSEPQTVPVVIARSQGKVLSMAFSPDGQKLLSASDDGSLLISEQAGALAERVCQLVWRNLSMNEWRLFVGEGIPYERTCPNLPSGEGVPVTAKGNSN